MATTTGTLPSSSITYDVNNAARLPPPEIARPTSGASGVCASSGWLLSNVLGVPDVSSNGVHAVQSRAEARISPLRGVRSQPVRPVRGGFEAVSVIFCMMRGERTQQRSHARRGLPDTLRSTLHARTCQSSLRSELAIVNGLHLQNTPLFVLFHRRTTHSRRANRNGVPQSPIPRVE